MTCPFERQCRKLAAERGVSYDILRAGIKASLPDSVRNLLTVATLNIHLELSEPQCYALLHCRALDIDAGSMVALADLDQYVTLTPAMETSVARVCLKADLHLAYVMAHASDADVIEAAARRGLRPVQAEYLIELHRLKINGQVLPHRNTPVAGAGSTRLEVMPLPDSAERKTGSSDCGTVTAGNTASLSPGPIHERAASGQPGAAIDGGAPAGQSCPAGVTSEETAFEPFEWLYERNGVRRPVRFAHMPHDPPEFIEIDDSTGKWKVCAGLDSRQETVFWRLVKQRCGCCDQFTFVRTDRIQLTGKLVCAACFRRSDWKCLACGWLGNRGFELVCKGCGKPRSQRAEVA